MLQTSSMHLHYSIDTPSSVFLLYNPSIIISTSKRSETITYYNSQQNTDNTNDFFS